MATVKTFSGRQLRSGWIQFMRTNRGLICIVVAVQVLLIGAITVMLLAVYGTTPVVCYSLGAVHAVALTVGYYTLRIAFLTANTSAIRHARGNAGEVNTRDELKRARRQRLIWGWVDSITLSSGDIDHLVITRLSGLIAIDSKWRSETVAADISRAAISARRSAGRAESVLRHLGYLARDQTARRRASTASISVTPLVSVWGPVRHEIPPAALVDGVQFVSGTELRAWLRNHRAEPVSRRVARKLLNDLEDFRDQHRPVKAAKRPA